MTTISHVRGCAPHSMTGMASDLVAQNDTFSARVRQMNVDVDTAMDGWQGDAATAAAARGLSQELAANHLGETITTLADHLDTYGAKLDGIRTALLTIVDHDIPYAGLTVDDTGAVQAPKVPAGTRNSSSQRSLAAMILQQGLNGNASGFQTRLEHLLSDFETAESEAAKAVAADLATLWTYEKTPDAAPLSSDVQDIISGKKKLPTDPQQLHDWWEKLTPAEKDALYQHDHYLGNHDGLPTVDRDHYNRLTLQDELTRAQNGDPAVEDKLGDLKMVAAEVDKPDRYLMLMDTQGSAVPKAAIASGNPDTASNIATYVPGTSSRPSSIDREMNRADAMRKAASRMRSDESVSVISWLGYNAPPELTDATQRHYADDGASSLDSFQSGLRASHNGTPSYNTVLGHSYGTTLVGDAASHGRSLNADSVIFVASPGTTVDSANDLNLTGVSHDDVASHVFATKAEHDPVPLYADTRLGGNMNLPFDDFGADPADKDYGAQVFKSDPGTADWYGYNTQTHSHYWDKGNKALKAMGDIIAGEGNQGMAIK